MKIYAPTTRATSRVGCLQSNGAPDSAPVDFDPAAHPIIARHFFGVEALRQFALGHRLPAELNIIVIEGGAV